MGRCTCLDDSAAQAVFLHPIYRSTIEQLGDLSNNSVSKRPISRLLKVDMPQRARADAKDDVTDAD